MQYNNSGSFGGDPDFLFKRVESPSCRACGHTKDSHYPKFGRANVPPLPCRHGLRVECKCKEYLPENNLEYLEYMEEYHGQKKD